LYLSKSEYEKQLQSSNCNAVHLALREGGSLPVLWKPMMILNVLKFKEPVGVKP
jgi:hypothetical protein